MEQTAAEKIVLNTGDIPSMPHVANLAMQKLSSPDASLRELQEIISKDQALAARVLRVANSVSYARSRSVKTIQDAVSTVGFTTIRSIIISCAMKDFFKSFGLAEKLIWEHSIGCALIAKTIAKQTRYPRTEEAFLAGLLHDVGKVILYMKIPKKMLLIIQEVYRNPEIPFFGLEKKLLGFTHAQVGGLVARKWNFAGEIVEAIALHHHPEKQKSGSPLAHITFMANAFSHKLGIGIVNNPDLNLSALPSARLLKLDGLVLSDLFDELQEALKTELSTFS